MTVSGNFFSLFLCLSRQYFSVPMFVKAVLGEFSCEIPRVEIQ